MFTLLVLMWFVWYGDCAVGCLVLLLRLHACNALFWWKMVDLLFVVGCY